MKKIIACLVALALATPVYADKQQKVEEWYQLNMNENTEKVFDSIYQMMLVPLECGLEMTAQDKIETKKQFMDILDMQGMVKQVIPVYAKHFTEEELDEILKFMKSPVGRKLQTTMALTAPEAMEISKNWINQKTPQLQGFVMQLSVKYKERPEAEAKQCLKDKNIGF